MAPGRPTGRPDTSRGGLLALVAPFRLGRDGRLPLPDDDRDPHRHGHRARHTNEGQLCCGRSLRGHLRRRGGLAPEPEGLDAVTRCDTNPATNECQDSSAVHLDGAGHLVLEIQNHKCPKVTSAQAYCIGRVQTMANGALPKNLPEKYVLHEFAAPFRMEWSMKMPTIPGSGGAAWSLSTWTTNAKRAGKRVEIDVQEGPAARADLLRCNWHFGGSQHVVRVSTGQDLAAKFHTYWMEVHAKRVVTGMDGTTCQDVGIPAGHRSDRWGAVVSAEVGSCSSSWWVACPDSAANWPDEVVVDSVRVTATQAPG